MGKAHGIFLTGDILRWHRDHHKANTHQVPFSHLSAIRGSWLGWCLRSDISNVQSEIDRVAHGKLWRRRWGWHPRGPPESQVRHQTGPCSISFSKAKQVLHGHLFKELKPRKMFNNGFHLKKKKMLLTKVFGITRFRKSIGRLSPV